MTTRLSPMPPINFRRPSTTHTTSSSGSDWDSLTLSRMLQNGARRKFDQGFEASLAKSELGASRHAHFLRSASAMGLHSTSSISTEVSSEPTLERLALDYVDLECLLQEKMREFNVNMPIFRHGRYHNRRERPFDRTNHASGEGVSSATEDHDPSAVQHGSTEQIEGKPLICTQDYVKRIREAAFLFSLCQQEVKLQISTHCPERARLVEKTLHFYSTILNYFIDPLEQTKRSFEALSRERCVYATPIPHALIFSFHSDQCCREGESRWQDEMMRQINDWIEKNSPLFQTEAWEGAGPVPCADCSDGFQKKIEYFWLLFNHAGRCIVQLQEIFIQRFQFRNLRIYPFIFTSSQFLIT